MNQMNMCSQDGIPRDTPYFEMPSFPHTQLLHFFTEKEAQQALMQRGEQHFGQQQVFPPNGAQHMFPQTDQMQVYPPHGAQQVFPHSGRQQFFLPNGMQQIYPQPAMQEIYPQPAMQQIYPQPDMQQIYPQPAMQQMYQHSGIQQQGVQQNGIHQEVQLNGMQQQQQPRPATSSDSSPPSDKVVDGVMTSLLETERAKQSKEEKNSNPCLSMYAVSQPQGTVERGAASQGAFHQGVLQQSIEHVSCVEQHVSNMLNMPVQQQVPPVSQTFQHDVSFAQLPANELGPSQLPILDHFDPVRQKIEEDATCAYLIQRFLAEQLSTDDLPYAQAMPHVHQMPAENFNYSSRPEQNHIVQMTPNVNPTTPTVEVEINRPHQTDNNVQIPIPHVQACMNPPVIDSSQVHSAFLRVAERSNAPTVAAVERMDITQSSAQHIPLELPRQQQDANTETTNEGHSHLVGGSPHNSVGNSLRPPIILSHAFINTLRAADQGSGGDIYVSNSNELRTAMQTAVDILKAARPGQSITVADALHLALHSASLARREPNNSSAFSLAHGTLTAIDGALLPVQTEDPEGQTEDVPMEVDAQEENATNFASDANEESEQSSGSQQQSSSHAQHGSAGRQSRASTPESLHTTPTTTEEPEYDVKLLTRVFGPFFASEFSPKALKKILSDYLMERIDVGEAVQKLNELLAKTPGIKRKFVNCVKQLEKSRARSSS